MSFVDKFDKELGTTRRRVLNLLARDKKFRNSDRKLYFAMLKESWDSSGISEEFKAIKAFDGLFLEALYKLLAESPDKSTMVRVRRQIQNRDKLYPPTDPKVIKKRSKRQDSFSQYYSPKNENEDNEGF